MEILFVYSIDVYKRQDIRFVDAFERDFKALAVSGRYEKLYLEMSVLSMTD